MKTLTPVKKTRLKPGVWLYDLGQNCSLLPRITVAGPAGARVTIETGEKFQGDRFVGACDRLASFNYVLRGRGDETWSPRFTYAGARWLLVQGAEDSSHAADASTPVVKSIEGVFVCSSSTPAGDFACSNDLFNRTAGIIDWAMRSNMMSILTDCPHRERLGWLEQIHLAGPSLMYRYDLAALLSKMTQDMADAQLANGLVPDIAPEYVVFDGRVPRFARMGQRLRARAVAGVPVLRRCLPAAQALRRDAALRRLPGFHRPGPYRRPRPGRLVCAGGHADAAGGDRILLPRSHGAGEDRSPAGQSRRCTALCPAGRRSPPGVQRAVLRACETPLCRGYADRQLPCRVVLGIVDSGRSGRGGRQTSCATSAAAAMP